MLPYQNQVVDAFLRMLRPGARDILEIGSDIGCEVATAIAQKTGANVVGINPSKEFPAPIGPVVNNAKFMRADGRTLPFSENSFDAVLSVATMEHVNGLDIFLSEVARVLKPKGFFYTEFSPIWSSAKGHHVYAVVGKKEARFWKPGKNPIPDYGHLLMTPDEMREYFCSSPCTEELIDPIIQWVYFEDSINRCYFEEYLEAFRNSPLIIENIHFGYDAPDRETLARLHSKYGLERDFRCASISAVFRKFPDGPEIQKIFFRIFITSRRILGHWLKQQTVRIGLLVRLFLTPFAPVLKLWRTLLKNT